MGRYRVRTLIVTVTLIILPAVFCNAQPPILNPAVITQSKTPLGDCQACKLFIESFKNGLERTARGKYEGGDTAWEEEKLKKSYKRSEMRLIDIQDGICMETSKHSVECHHMAEKAEEYIEEWWSQDRDESEDLYTYICIEKIKVCCPKHHYGKDCNPCPGEHSNLCSGNGKCRGDGTRKGNGTCLCETGYEGDNCEQCAPGHYLENLDDNKILCSPCHSSCVGDCRAGSNKDCSACKPGYAFDPDEGCLDIDECDNMDVCRKDSFCMNSIGSYSCTKCDRACNGCNGDGPDMCKKCAKEFSRKGEFCVPVREDAVDHTEKMTTTRFMTYVGLLVATCILLPRSKTLGSMVGVMVLGYIFGAEYYCMINGHSGLVDLKDYDLSQVFHT